VSQNTRFIQECERLFFEGQVLMPVQMQLSRIIISEINDQQVIYLRETDGERQFPILIGIFEATSIDRHVKRVASPRPLTHDLLVNVVEELGGELDSVVICDLQKHTYYAKLRIRMNGELIDVDSRPSDAIAIAMTCDPPLPIYVSEEVLRDSLAGDDAAM
jgi:bifunctional DNase/RNase